jgi:hypothetical protein
VRVCKPEVVDSAVNLSITRPTIVLSPGDPTTTDLGKRLSPACGIWRLVATSISRFRMATAPTKTAVVDDRRVVCAKVVSHIKVGPIG